MTNKYPDLMIDLETYGIKHDGAILQIAAVPFNIVEGSVAPEPYFNKKVDLMSSIANGGTVSQSTVDWWNTQDQELHREMLSGTESMPYVLHKLNNFIAANVTSQCNIWAHATFDPVLVQNAYDGCGIKPSYRYWQPKDLRTLEYLAVAKSNNLKRPEFIGRKHDALADCLYQIECACLWYKALRS